MNKQELIEKSYKLRRKIVEVCYRSQAGHVGGSLSAIDILNVLYNHEMNINPQEPMMEGRDRFILSKGHVAEALFVTLADRGYFNEEELDTFSCYRSNFIGHPNNKIAGIEMNTGALGHGLSLGVGMAMGARMNQSDAYTYVLMGDGEQAEGSIWEAAMAASHYQLDHLIAILDRNGLQISGTTEEVMSLQDIKAKWESFGFHVIEFDGNDYTQLLTAFQEAKEISGCPVLLLANTVKGKGVSFMEHQIAWHHGELTEGQYHQAIKELGGVTHG